MLFKNLYSLTILPNAKVESGIGVLRRRFIILCNCFWQFRQKFLWRAAIYLCSTSFVCNATIRLRILSKTCVYCKRILAFSLVAHKKIVSHTCCSKLWPKRLLFVPRYVPHCIRQTKRNGFRLLRSIDNASLAYLRSRGSDNPDVPSKLCCQLARSTATSNALLQSARPSTSVFRFHTQVGPTLHQSSQTFNLSMVSRCGDLHRGGDGTYSHFTQYRDGCKTGRTL